MNQSTRRSVFKMMGAASLLSLYEGKTLLALDSPPIPENVMTSEAALECLIAGNARYISGKSNSRNFSRTAFGIPGPR